MLAVVLAVVRCVRLCSTTRRSVPDRARPGQTVPDMARGVRHQVSCRPSRPDAHLENLRPGADAWGCATSGLTCAWGLWHHESTRWYIQHTNYTIVWASC